MRKRLSYIDRLKGLAIFLVVIGHIYQYIVEKGDQTKLFSMIYSFHMPLFFFLSGYISEKTNKMTEIKDIIPYLLNKACSLLVPLISWALLNYLLFNLNRYCLQDLRNLILKQFTDPNLWFLLMLFKIFIVYAPLYLLSKKIKTNKKIIIDSFILLCSIITILFMGKVIFNTTSLAFLLNFLFFMIGVFLSRYDEVIYFTKNIYFNILSAFGFLIFAYLYDFHNTHLMTMKLFKVIASFFGVFSLFHIANTIKLPKVIENFLTEIGKWTLVIYTTHFLFFYIIESKLLIPSSFNSFLVFFIVNILAIMLIYICVFIGTMIKYIYMFDFLLYGNYKRKSKK